MSFDIGPAPPPADVIASANRLWTSIDERVESGVSRTIQSELGIARNRVITINVQLAGDTTPLPGLIQSVFIDTPIRIVGWQIHSIVSGEVVVDIRSSTIMADPLTPPVPTSMPGLAVNFPALNGYTVSSQDTTAWTRRDLLTGVLNIYVVSASLITSTIMGIQCLDLGSRVLQR